MYSQEKIRKIEKIDLDAILINDIGQFGKFQIKNTFLIMVVAIFSGWATSETLFTTSRITKRCLIPECEGQRAENCLPSWVPNAVPTNGKSFDNCRRFISKNSSIIAKDVCPRDLFYNELTKPCSAFVYEDTNSVVYDFHLGCDEWRRPLIGSLRAVGALASLPVTGFISDQWGRKTAIILASMNAAWIGTTRYYANTYLVYLISKITEATLGSGAFSSSYILFSAVGISGFWIAVILLENLGKKPVLIGAYWLCGICQIGYIMLPKELFPFTLIIYLIGKFSISMVITSLYVYTAELYPTSHRHRLFAFSSLVGRLGSIVAPLTPAFSFAVWTYLPFALFAGFAFLFGFLVLFTPETFGIKVPDTMEEATIIGIKSPESNV